MPGKPVSYGYDSVDELDVGSIVNITSLGAERCLDRYPLAAYNAAKAGVAALTRSFASEWGPHGVRANSLGPAFFPTRLSGFLEDPSQTEWIASHTALRRPANLDELDGALLFLASDASSYVTGQHLFVDGGWSVSSATSAHVGSVHTYGRGGVEHSSRALGRVGAQGSVSHVILRSHLKTLSDRRDIRDVTGADDGSGERDESVDQFLELFVVESVVGGEGEGIGAILDVGPYRLASRGDVAVRVEQPATDESR